MTIFYHSMFFKGHIHQWISFITFTSYVCSDDYHDHLSLTSLVYLCLRLRTSRQAMDQQHRTRTKVLAPLPARPQTRAQTLEGTRTTSAKWGGWAQKGLGPYLPLFCCVVYFVVIVVFICLEACFLALHFSGGHVKVSAYVFFPLCVIILELLLHLFSVDTPTN